ncbi:Exocyst complex component 5 [Kappamyces sp. JEL0680]|nr:Exocyst complex component 5 [Kappamyces sp. JEL0680]
MNALKRLYEEIRVAVVNEWDVIYDVFPNASTVIQVFVQRIFAQSVQNFLETLMQEALEKSAQVYLEILTQSHRETAILVSDMHSFDENVIAPLLGSQALTLILDRSLEDLYVPYVSEERYFQAEFAWLKENFELYLSKFLEAAELLNSSGKKNQRGKPHSTHSPVAKDPISSMVVSNLFSTVTTTVNTMTSDLKQHLNTAAPSPNLVDREADLVPTLDIAIRCVKCTYQSFERAKELCKPQEVVLDKMQSVDLKSEPEFGFFRSIKVSHQVIQMIQLHFQTYESEIIVVSPNVHREMLMAKNELVSVVESKLNGIVQRRITSILSWIELILSKQKKSDYNMKDGLLENTVSTATCNEITGFLRHVTDEGFDSLDEQNRESYFLEIGTSICNDITRYHEVIIQFRVESLNEYFSVLKELSNLYIVKPENLKMVLQEGYLGRMELSVLHSYLYLRADWSKLARLEKDFFNTSQ